MTTVRLACAALVASLAFASACSAPLVAPEDPMKPLVGAWTLEELAGASIPALAIETGPPSVTVDTDGRVSGSTGVNRFQGTLDVALAREGHFVVGPLATTRRAGPPEAMRLEQSVLNALASATDWRVDARGLVLARGEAVLARGVRAPR